jgi:cytochrome b pre-mRNA-processing protein 3
LYGAAVAAARDPYLYLTLGVPDTLDGRFDMVGLHAFLLIHRLSTEPPLGPPLAQAVFDAMFADMDVNLREMGVGDLSVGKRVRAMWEAFNGRSAVYAAALEAQDTSALAASIARNVWRGGDAPEGAPAGLARLAFAQHAHLTAQKMAALSAGSAQFLPAAEAAR